MNKPFLSLALLIAASSLNIQSVEPGAQMLLLAAVGAAAVGQPPVDGAVEHWVPNAMEREFQRLFDNDQKMTALNPGRDCLKKPHCKRYVSARQEKLFKPQLSKQRNGARRQQSGALNRQLKNR